MAVASGGDEEGEEDGEIVAGVDEGGGGDGARPEADGGEDEGDAEEDEERGPGVGSCSAWSRMKRTLVMMAEKMSAGAVRLVVMRQRSWAAGVRGSESQS